MLPVGMVTGVENLFDDTVSSIPPTRDLRISPGQAREDSGADGRAGCGGGTAYGEGEGDCDVDLDCPLCPVALIGTPSPNKSTKGFFFPPPLLLPLLSHELPLPCIPLPGLELLRLWPSSRSVNPADRGTSTVILFIFL